MGWIDAWFGCLCTLLLSRTHAACVHACAETAGGCPGPAHPHLWPDSLSRSHPSRAAHYPSGEFLTYFRGGGRQRILTHTISNRAKEVHMIGGTGT